MVFPSIHGRVFCVFHRFVTRGLIIRLGFLLDLFFPLSRTIVHPFIRYRIIFCKILKTNEEQKRRRRGTRREHCTCETVCIIAEATDIQMTNDDRG